MNSLRIHLLGVVRVTHQGWFKETEISRTVKALLAYLTLFRHRTHAREVLVNLFWGERNEKRARSCLSTALWRLRKTLEPKGILKGTYLITTFRGDVGFNPESKYWLDVEEFEKHAKPILGKAYKSIKLGEARQLENYLKLYKGELLEGFYDDWVLGERERLRALYLQCQAHLLQVYSYNGAYDQALTCGLRILNFDPLREEIHREMMRLYYKKGQRALALKHYDKCCKILEKELGVAPMEETQLLRIQIFNRAGPARVQLRSQGNLDDVQKAIVEFQEALRIFDQSTELLRQAGKTLERIIHC